MGYYSSNRPNGNYGIPLHNPFAQNQNTKTLAEINAYGFRKSHRITWTKSGEMLACNIGQKNIESVNLIMLGHKYLYTYNRVYFIALLWLLHRVLFTFSLLYLALAWVVIT